MLRQFRILAFTALTVLSVLSSSTVTAQSPVLNRVLKTEKLRVGM